MSEQVGKTEFVLKFSNKGGVEQVDGPLADARRIQNLLFTSPMAGMSGIGAQIQSYIMESNSEAMKAEIEENIRSQVNQYCPDVTINTLVIQSVKDGTLRNSLFIGISLGLSVPFNFVIKADMNSQGTISSALLFNNK